ncbi:MAG: leucine-rich repeat domain-containing protein [Planctomycetaceae bacterium]
MRSLSGLAFLLLLPLFSGCTESSGPAGAPSSPSELAAKSAAVQPPKELAEFVKQGPDGSVIEADLRKAEVTAELLKLLSPLTTLRTLNLAGTAFNDELAPLLATTVPQLTSLDVRSCALSDAAMVEIAKCTGLRVLRMSGKENRTTVSDEGLAALAPLKSLKVIALDDLWIGKPGLEHLTTLNSLEEIYLSATIVDDDAVSVLTKFPRLRKLRLARTNITDGALASLSACSQLEELDLSEISTLTDAGMSSLAALTSLKKLNLWRVQISDTGALALAPLTSLQWLNLDNTKLSDAGLPVLKDMQQLTFLHLGSTQITAAAAPALFHLKSLKDLKITRTALAASETAVADLRKELASTAIQTEYEGGAEQ